MKCNATAACAWIGSLFSKGLCFDMTPCPHSHTQSAKLYSSPLGRSAGRHGTLCACAPERRTVAPRTGREYCQDCGTMVGAGFGHARGIKKAIRA